MEKYKFPTLSQILKTKVGTKYVWEERVRLQANMVHMMEELYGIKLNLRAFSFYPNYTYFGMPISANPEMEKSRILWSKIQKIFMDAKWNVYAAYEHVDPKKRIPTDFDTFEDLGFDHAQLLLSEIALMDLNYPSFGVGQQLEISMFAPVIGFSKNPVSRMVLGRSGGLILRYESESELLNMLGEIAKRKSFSKEPFYIRKNADRHLLSVYKGKECLNEKYKRNLW